MNTSDPYIHHLLPLIPLVVTLLPQPTDSMHQVGHDGLEFVFGQYQHLQIGDAANGGVAATVT